MQDDEEADTSTTLYLCVDKGNPARSGQGMRRSDSLHPGHQRSNSLAAISATASASPGSSPSSSDQAAERPA